MDKSRSYFLVWANLVDMGCESMLAHITQKKSRRLALDEIRKTLLQHSEDHWHKMYNMLKKLN